VYRCHHCNDLHVTADQARSCFESQGDWYDDALREVDRILARGPKSWSPDRAPSDGTAWTMPERRLWNALTGLVPAEIRSQSWIPDCGIRVDLLIPAAALAILIDGSSHAAAGAERLRSGSLRSAGLTVLRVPDAVAMSAADRVAAVVAERIHGDAARPRAAVPA
jgi:very-short-patch-repair endonuclease